MREGYENSANVVVCDKRDGEVLRVTIHDTPSTLPPLNHGGDKRTEILRAATHLHPDRTCLAAKAKRQGK